MLKKLNIFTFLLLPFLFVPAVSGVETIIVGDVVNESTGDPVPNVNIHFRGTKVGTTSDENGSYILRVDMAEKAQLVFSAVGYYKQQYEITPGVMAGLQVALRERAAILTEVVVSPNENPALELLRKVRDHRLSNDRTYHSDRVNTLLKEQSLYVSHIQKRHLRRALWKSLQSGMIAQEDSTYILPLYRETQSYCLEGSNAIPANDRCTQALILSSTDYSSLLGGEGNLNFYANSVSLLGHAFLSPLASSGNLYYRYYIDETVLPEDSISGTIVVRFKTRNPFYATFNGTMAIDTLTYALRSIHAYTPAETAVNYVNTLHLSQTLHPDGTIESEAISAVLDFAVQSDKAGTFFPTVLINTSLIETGTSREAYSSVSEPQRTADGDSIFTRIDSLPLIRTAKWFATIATTGYIPTGSAVDIGHIEEILQVNRHEGVHFGLPFRTNERFSQTVSLEASIGYGIKDRAPKGMGRISFNLPTGRKNILQFEFNDRYVWSEVDDFDRLLRENSMGWGNFDFTAYAFEALSRDSLYVSTAMRQRQIQLHWFADWLPELETHTYVRAGWQPLTGESLYAYQTLSLIARLSWGERKYDGFFMRRYAYSSLYPVFSVGLETGHWSQSCQTKSGLYAHLRLMLTQHAHLGMGGTLSYAFQTGAIFGTVPPFLLWQADANQGFAYDPYRYTFLHGGELTADKYAALQAEWNGQGILFSLIPGVRWLHLRELIEGKIAYGYEQAAGKGMMYAEIGVGIGNILRLCDLYSVWSLSPSMQWGIRFRIHLGL